jgi:hypothetical protein
MIAVVKLLSGAARKNVNAPGVMPVAPGSRLVDSIVPGAFTNSKRYTVDLISWVILKK